MLCMQGLKAYRPNDKELVDNSDYQIVGIFIFQLRAENMLPLTSMG